MPKITVRYADGGTLIFVPDAGRRFFDEDDALKLAEIWEKAAQIAEWSGIAEGIDERFARQEAPDGGVLVYADSGPPYMPQSPNLLEGKFCELRVDGVLGSRIAPVLLCRYAGDRTEALGAQDGQGSGIE